MGDGESQSPKTIEELVFEMLETSLDYGITEEQFWSMTFGEIDRAVRSRIRVQKLQSQERASFDYILANLITKGVSKVLGDKSAFPSVEEVYSGLFDNVIQERDEKIKEQKMNLSALRFKQFAQSYNKKFEEVAKTSE